MSQQTDEQNLQTAERQQTAERRQQHAANENLPLQNLRDGIETKAALIAMQ